MDFCPLKMDSASSSYTTTRCHRTTDHKNARYEVLTAILLMIEVFWNVTPCRLVDTDVSDDRSASIFRGQKSMKGTFLTVKMKAVGLDPTKRC
jgi:hypothetical protein